MVCPMCGKNEEQKRFERHLQLCSRKLRCTTCGSGVDSKEMHEHLEQHAKRGAFRCPFGCAEVYTRLKNYLRDRQSHNCEGVPTQDLGP